MKSSKIFRQWDDVLYPSVYNRVCQQGVKIIMSSDCVLNCKYCINNKGIKFPSTINNTLIDYLNNDLAREINGSMVLTFHTGEPLCFLDMIEEFCSKINLNKYVPFITTNGYLLTDNIVQRLNNLNMRVSISHDGINTLSNRGYDVIADNKDLILKLNNFCGFSSVLSESSWNIYELDSYFKSQFEDPKFQRFSPRRVRLRGEEYRFGEIDAEQLNDMWARIIARIIMSDNPLSTNEFQWIKDYVDRALYHQLNPSISSEKIVNKEFRVTLDLDGNWYYSWFYPEKVGTIYDSLESLLFNYRSLLPRYWHSCFNKCSVLGLCRGGIAGEVKAPYLCDYIETAYNNIRPLFYTDIIASYLEKSHVYGSDSINV